MYLCHLRDNCSIFGYSFPLQGLEKFPVYSLIMTFDRTIASGDLITLAVSSLKNFGSVFWLRFLHPLECTLVLGDFFSCVFLALSPLHGSHLSHVASDIRPVI